MRSRVAPAPRPCYYRLIRDTQRRARFSSGEAMKAAVRPFASTDLEGVARLRTLAFSRPEAWDTDWQSSVWRWLGTHPLADELHRWVVVTEEGEVVGHLAAVPQFYRIGRERVVAHTPADYAVLPGHGFHALSLMRRFFRTVENCVACDAVPEVIGVETKLGAEEAGKLQVAAKVWDVRGVPNLPTSIPTLVPHLLNWGLRVVDRALSNSLSAGALKVEVLDDFGASFDELFESVTSSMLCVPEKDAAFLRWRYGPGSPQYPVTVLGVREGQTLLGYAVLWVTVDGDNGHLLDLTTLPGRRDVARSLLREAIKHFARSGVHSIRYRFVESQTSPRTKDAWRLGFFLRRSRSTLLVKFADRKLHAVASDTANWSYSFGDGEATFWVR
jgi:ribosomal protein S18 acetylase RimI-like enzyme